MRELKELSSHRRIKSVDTCDTVTNRDHRTGLANFDALVVVLDLTFDDRTNFFNIDSHLDALEGLDFFQNRFTNFIEMGSHRSVVNRVTHVGNYAPQKGLVYF